MADYSDLIAQIRASIRPNGAGAITGQSLQDILVSMVNRYPETGGGGTEVQTVDVANLDGMVTGPTDAAAARDTGLYVVTSGGWNAGRLFVFSDSMHHVVTQVLLTHYTGKDNTLNEHTDGEIHLLYRSYGMTGVPPGHGVSEGSWSAWQDVLGQTTAELDQRVEALEETVDDQQRNLEGVASTALTAETWANVSVPAVFDAVLAGPLTMQESSVVDPSRIVFSTADKGFYAQKGLNYYFSWTYTTQDGAHRGRQAYGVKGKTYLCTSTNTLYVLTVDGSLLEVAGGGGGGGGTTYDVVTADTAGLASPEMFTRLLQKDVYRYSSVSTDLNYRYTQLAEKLRAWCSEAGGVPILREYETNDGAGGGYVMGIALMWRNESGESKRVFCVETTPDNDVSVCRAFVLHYIFNEGVWQYVGKSTVGGYMQADATFSKLASLTAGMSGQDVINCFPGCSTVADVQKRLVDAYMNGVTIYDGGNPSYGQLVVKKYGSGGYGLQFTYCNFSAKTQERHMISLNINGGSLSVEYNETGS